MTPDRAGSFAALMAFSMLPATACFCTVVDCRPPKHLARARSTAPFHPPTRQLQVEMAHTRLREYETELQAARSELKIAGKENWLEERKKDTTRCKTRSASSL